MKLASFFTEIGFKIDDSALEQMKAKVRSANETIKNSIKGTAVTSKQATDDMNSHVIAWQRQQARSRKQQAGNEIRQAQRTEALKRREAERTAAHNRRLELEQTRHRNRLHLQEMRQQARRVGGGGMFSGSTAGLKAYGGAALGGFGAFTIGRQLFETGTTMAGLRSAFTMLMGDGAKAEEQIAFINREVDRLSLNLPSTANDFKQLMASAQARLGAEGVQELFSGLSEVGLVLGLTVDQQQRAIRAFGQMASKGKISSEELKGQLAEALPGAVDIFAKSLDIEPAVLFKMMEDGKLLAEDVLPKVAARMRSMTTEEQRAIAKNSPARKLNELQTAYTRFLDELGKSGAYDALTALFDGLKTLIDFIKPATPVLGQFLGVIKVFVKDVFGLVKGLIIGIDQLSGKLGLFAAAIGVFVASFGWVPLAIGGVVFAIVEFLTILTGSESLMHRWASEDGWLGYLAKGFIFLTNAIGTIIEPLLFVADVVHALLFDFTKLDDAFSNSSLRLQARFGEMDKAWNGSYIAQPPKLLSPTTAPQSSGNEDIKVHITLDDNLQLQHKVEKIADTRINNSFNMTAANMVGVR